jgi:hypothetical protein
MTDEEMRQRLRFIRSIPNLERYARKTIGIETIARRAGLNRLTVYRSINPGERLFESTKTKIKEALEFLGVDGSEKKPHPRMLRHAATLDGRGLPSEVQTAGVAPGPSGPKNS